MASVFLRVAFYRLELCAESLSIPPFLCSFALASITSPFIPPLSLFPPACAPLLVINLAGSIPEGYLALIYELRVVPPAVQGGGRGMYLPFLILFFFSSSFSSFSSFCSFCKGKKGTRPA